MEWLKLLLPVLPILFTAVTLLVVQLNLNANSKQLILMQDNCNELIETITAINSNILVLGFERNTLHPSMFRVSEELPMLITHAYELIRRRNSFQYSDETVKQAYDLLDNEGFCNVLSMIPSYPRDSPYSQLDCNSGNLTVLPATFVREVLVEFLEKTRLIHGDYIE